MASFFSPSKVIGTGALCAFLAVAIVWWQDAGASGPDVARAIEAQERHTQELLGTPGVAGTGVGLNAAGEAVVRIYVEAPGLQNLPQTLEGVPVEIVVTGRFVARCDKQSRCDRPVPIGISSGHPSITAGTLGARVSNADGIFALSNNHVYANNNDASLGDAIIQPGTFDGGSNPADKIGELYDFDPLNFSGGDNLMDAAIAVTTAGEVSSWTPDDGYGTPSGDFIECTEGCANLLGLQVQKYGRTTGLTTATITEINVTTDVCYVIFAVFCVQQARFVDQIAITPGTFSAGGDSGSLIVTQSGRDAVALLFAGSEARTLGNRIDLVLDRFGVVIDSGSAMPSPTPTSTAMVTASATPTATVTNTPVPPTPTSTSTPTATPTNTPLPPTSTATATPTPSATSTPTATATLTPMPTPTPTVEPGLDSSGDGYTDAEKIALGKDPADYCDIMRADVNHDGVVTILDITLVVPYFGQEIPPAPERYDQNADGVITILDITAQAGLFGRSVEECP